MDALLHYGTIFLYVAVFGISDIIIKKYNITGKNLILYFIFCLIIGIVMTVPYFINKYYNIINNK